MKPHNKWNVPNRDQSNITKSYIYYDSELDLQPRCRRPNKGRGYGHAHPGHQEFAFIIAPTIHSRGLHFVKIYQDMIN